MKFLVRLRFFVCLGVREGGGGLCDMQAMLRVQKSTVSQPEKKN